MPRSGEFVLTRLSCLAADILDFDIDTYLANHGNRKLFGLQINKAAHNYSPLFGDPQTKLYEGAPFIESLAGYSVDVASRLPGLEGVNADVFLISDEVLDEDDLAIDTIILHELVHLLIDSDR